MDGQSSVTSAMRGDVTRQLAPNHLLSLGGGSTRPRLRILGISHLSFGRFLPTENTFLWPYLLFCDISFEPNIRTHKWIISGWVFITKTHIVSQNCPAVCCIDKPIKFMGLFLLSFSPLSPRIFRKSHLSFHIFPAAILLVCPVLHRWDLSRRQCFRRYSYIWRCH